VKSSTPLKRLRADLAAARARGERFGSAWPSALTDASNAVSCHISTQPCFRNLVTW
jgi:hypothetical protein